MPVNYALNKYESIIKKDNGACDFCRNDYFAASDYGTYCHGRECTGF